MKCRTWEHISKCNAELIQDGYDGKWFYGCVMSFCQDCVCHRTASLTKAEAKRKMRMIEQEVSATEPIPVPVTN